MKRNVVFSITLALAWAALTVGCGSGADTDADSGVGAGGSAAAPLTIDQALAVGDADRAWVEGSLLVLGDQTRLCSVLAESYPPSCAGSSLVVEGLDAASLVGLSRTNPDSGVSDASWSDFPVVLSGSLADGALTVDAPPTPVGEATSGGLLLRFDHAPRPAPASGVVFWLFEITNTSDREIRLTFGNGQKGEVILSRDGAEVYRWSADKFFTEAIEELSLVPGGSYGFHLSDPLTLEPGDYDARVFLTASDPDLPEVMAVVTLE
ncbi:MAG: hypothetical protein KKA32_06585 [Actinobacteria bacterium]|nr:hypothetical protein [Actinomycetota bacterium]